MQNATIQAGDVSYNVARDEYMFDRVAQILEIEDAERDAAIVACQGMDHSTG